MNKIIFETKHKEIYAAQIQKFDLLTKNIKTYSV